MASATLPKLSTVEHIRLDLARFIAALAANVAALWAFGPGWHCVVAFGLPALALAFVPEAVAAKWGRRRGVPTVTAEQWQRARQTAFRSWPLTLVGGFCFGFIVLGGSLDLTPSDAVDWVKRLFLGFLGTASAVLLAMPWKRQEERRDPAAATP